MSAQAFSDVLDHYPVGGPELLVALILSDGAGEDGSFSWPSQDVLARKARLTVPQLTALIADMEASGRLQFVATERYIHGLEHVYRLQFATDTAPA